MRRTLIRQISIGAVVAVVAAAVGGAAFAANGPGKFRAMHSLRAGGFGPGGFLGGPGGGMGFGFGHRGGPGGGMGRGPGGPGGGGMLAIDVLTPAAACLNNMSLTTLEADLKSGKTLAQEAGGGSKATDLINCIVAAQKKNLDNEAAAGWITADQETALVASLTRQITGLVNDGPPVPPSGGAKSGGLLQSASTYLGISVSDLQADLKAGKSLSSLISGSQTVDGLVAAIEAPVKANLDAAVTANKITQAQEDAILSRTTSGLTKFVNGTANTTQSNTVKKNLRKFALLKSFGTIK